MICRREWFVEEYDLYKSTIWDNDMLYNNDDFEDK